MHPTRRPPRAAGRLITGGGRLLRAALPPLVRLGTRLARGGGELAFGEAFRLGASAAGELGGWLAPLLRQRIASRRRAGRPVPEPSTN